MGKIYQVTIKYTEWTQNIPNGHKIYQHLPFQDPPKFTQFGIFGLKIYHLAALAETIAVMPFGSHYLVHAVVLGFDR
jgi:hypothetical protein